MSGNQGAVWRRAVSVIGTLLVAFASLSWVAPASQAAVDPGYLTLEKTVEGWQDGHRVDPNETFTYTLTFTCSSISADGGCNDAVITDQLPAWVLPVGGPGGVVVSVDNAAGGASGYTTTISATNEVKVEFTLPASSQSGGPTGLPPTTGTIKIPVRLDPSIPATQDGKPLKNTAEFTASNADPQADDFTVVPRVPAVLKATPTKSYTPAEAVALPGTPTTLRIEASNASNVPVSSLTITDPVDPAATPNPFTHLGLTGSLAVTLPTGAEQVRVDAYVDGAWVTGTAAASAALPAGVVPADVRGIRVTYLSTDGADIPTGASSSIEVALTQRAGITAGTIANRVSAVVTRGPDTSPPTTADATYVTTSGSLPVAATKTFTPDKIAAGDSSTVKLTATNSSNRVADSLTIVEPGAGQNPFRNGLTFAGWATPLTWPTGATGASVTWTYADGTTSTAPADARNTLPAPDAQAGTVVGFSVTFTGAIVAGGEATVPFTVVSDDTQGVAELDHPNHIGVSSTAPGGYTGATTAQDTLTTIEKRLAVEVDKRIVDSEIYGRPGEHTTVGLTGHVRPFPESSTRATRIVLTDPDDTGTDTWYDHFAPTGIVATPVPTNATLTVQWFDGTQWADVPGMTALPGGQTLHTIAFPAAVRSNAKGIRFVYESTHGFPPDTQVKPNLSYAVTSTVTAPTRVENCAGADASSAVATAPHAVDPTCPSITLTPYDGTGGNGGIGIDKTWQPALVGERSNATTTARIAWRVGRSGLDNVVVSDTANPSAATLAGSVFDSFDLVGIGAISTADDPYLQYDRVTGVQRYSRGLDKWVPVSNDPCSNPSACDGTFPGYTLPTQDAADTIGIRLTFSESPNRAALVATTPGAPPVGSGVARSGTANRVVPLVFRVRDVRRSDSNVPVLADTPLNVTGTPGAVANTAGLTAYEGFSVVGQVTDTERIGITDVPLTTEITKTWSGGPVGIPAAGTAFPADWPTTRVSLTATNTSPRRVDELTIVEPAGATPFERFNLAGFGSFSVDGGMSLSQGEVLLHRSNGTTAVATLAGATAMTEVDLVDVVGFEVKLAGRIPSATTLTAVVDLRLRPTGRTSGTSPTAGERVDNLATSTVRDLVAWPGRVESNTDEADASVHLREQGIGVRTTKSFIPSRQTEPVRNSVTMTLTGQPQGPSRSNKLVVTDDDETFWNAYELVSIPHFSFAAPINRVQMSVLTGATFSAQGGTLTRTGGTWADGPAGNTPTLPAGVTADQVQGVRFTYTRADGAIWENPATPNQAVQLQVRRRQELRSGGDVPSTLRGNVPAPGETTAGITVNTVRADTYAPEMSGGAPLHASSTADASITYAHARNSVAVTKSPAGAFGPTARIPYRLTFRNDGAVAIFNPVITDRLPADADGAQILVDEESQTPYRFTLAGTAPTTPSGTPMPVALGGTGGVTLAATDELLTFTFPPGTVLEVGQTYTIEVDMVFREGLPGQLQVRNTTGITGDRAWDNCGGTLTGDECRASTTVHPTVSGALRGVKTVKAVDDELGVLDTLGTGCTADADGFHRGGCIPLTKPGADEVWRMTWTNVGNLPLRTVTAIDKLPALNDTGAIVPGQRGTEWRPTPKYVQFVSGAPMGSVKVFHNAPGQNGTCTSDLDNGGSCASGYWVEVPETGGRFPLPAQAHTLKFVFELSGTGLAPRDKIKLDLVSTTPAVSPTVKANPIAWNTIAQSAAAIDGTSLRHVPRNESNKVGVSMATGPLEVTKTVTGAGAAFAPAQFDLDVACTSAGTALALGARGDLTVTAGAVERVEHLPWGSRCTVTEDAATSGATDFTATDVTVAAEADTPVRISAVNTYDLASVTVSKAVRDSALDAAGTPIDYGRFDFAMACTFLGNPVHASGHGPNAPMEVSLGDGESHTFTGLPAGASCTVTETDDLGATSTSVQVTTAAGQVTAPSGGFQLTADATQGQTSRPTNTVEFTNRFATGSLELTKAVTGAGAAAYGQRTFGVDLVCVDPNNREVYAKSFLLGGTHPLTHTIDDLYAGATCTASETITGGATEVTITPASPVGVLANDTVSITVENRFDLGSLEVTKAITGAGAALVGDRSFEVRAVCTREVDSRTETVSLPDDGRVTLSRSRGLVATYADLPIGTTCKVSETRTGAATETTISDSGTATVLDPKEPAALTITNRFDVGSLVVTKELTGAGAGIVPDDRTFEVRAVCTQDVDGRTEPVALADDGRRTLSRAGGLSTTYDNLPIGAVCHVSETRTGAATSSTVSSSGRAVIDDPKVPARISVTNDFRVGGIRVTKSIEGKAAGEVPAKLAFEIRASCVQRIDGVDVAVPVSGDGLRTVSTRRGMVAMFDNLPVGATCTITETDDGGADRTRISPATVVVGDGEVAEVSVVNVFRTPPGDDDKPGEETDPDDGGNGNGNGPEVEGTDGNGPGAGPHSQTGAEVAGPRSTVLLLGGGLAGLVALLGAYLLVRRQRRA